MEPVCTHSINYETKLLEPVPIVFDIKQAEECFRRMESISYPVLCIDLNKMICMFCSSMHHAYGFYGSNEN